MPPARLTVNQEVNDRKPNLKEEREISGLHVITQPLKVRFEQYSFKELDICDILM